MPRPPTSKGPAPSAKARALKLLTRREHSARELEEKLAARGVDRDEAARAVGELAQAGWQSDARYVESLVRSRVAQGYGPLRIEAELEQAGVADALARSALTAAEVDWNAQAAELRRRKFGETPPRKAADWQKQYRYLAGRGFETGQIYAALKNEAPD